MASALQSEFIVSVNGTPHKVPAELGNLTLNEWIRTHAGVKSTKLGCGEGGCGACAVMISSTDPATGASKWRSINSCLSPVYLAHGEDVMTAEGLPAVEEGAPKVTERLAAFHASQCGFCTPGMAVACHAALTKCQEKGVQPTAETMRDAVDGNLCRCTGYRPIVDACKSFAGDVDIEDLGLSTYGKDALAKLPCKQVAPITRGPYQAPKGVAERFQLANGQQLVVPCSLEQLVQELGKEGAHLVAGNTSPGIYKDWPLHPLLISVSKVPELRSICFDEDGALVFGAAVTLAALADELEAAGKQGQMWREMSAHINRIAGHHVRNAASVGGNVVLARTRNLPSDMATLLLAAGGEAVVIGPSSGERQTFSLDQFLQPSFSAPALDALSSGGSLLQEIRVPNAAVDSARFWSSRLAHRYTNSVADLNAAVKLTFSGPSVASARFALGFDEGSTQGHLGVWHLARLTSLEAGLVGLTSDSLLDPATADKLTKSLAQDLQPLLGDKLGAGDARAAYVASAAEGFLRQALAALGQAAGPEAPDTPPAPGSLPAKLPKPAVMKGRQSFADPDPEVAPLTAPMVKVGAELQAVGTALYTDDVQIAKGALFAAMVVSTKAHAKLVSIDVSKALQIPGVSSFVGAKDIPGVNQGMCFFSVPVPGTFEPMFATEVVEYYGQPLGVVLADSYQTAQRAAKLVEVTYDTEGMQVIASLKAAVEAKSFYNLTHLFPTNPVGPSAGGNSFMVQTPGTDIDAALAAAPCVDRGGRYTLPAQTHMYMEPQTAVVTPDEDGQVHVVASSQFLDAAHHTVAKALNLPMNKVHVTTRRMGGAYGGKFSHAMKIMTAAAVAAHKTKKQVRLAVDRCTDFAMFGGRMETEVDYSIGYDSQGLIHAVDMKVVVQAGAFQDGAFFELFVMSGSPDTVYYIPAMRAEFIQVRTHTPPRTFVRGPGETQVQLIMENLIEHVAARTGLDAALVRERNMLHARQKEARAMANGEAPPAEGEGAMLLTGFGKQVKEPEFSLPRIWQELKEQTQYDKLAEQVKAFNAENRYRKRGLSMVPCKYSLSGGKRAAMVTIYPDGSVMVAHSGTEMGQGLATKVVQTTACELRRALGQGAEPFPVDLIRTGDTSTLLLPFYSLTGGSTTSESACEGVRKACAQLVERLGPLAESKRGADGKALTWRELVAAAFAGPMPFVGMPPNVPMTAYAIGDISEQVLRGQGYTTYGAAVVMAELDALTGDRQVLSVDLLFDAGKTLNPAIDIGQVEGAFTHGMGALLNESFEVHPHDGTPATATTWKYKVPGVHCAPHRLNISLLKDSVLHIKGPVSCKAVGEPPLLLSSGVLLALQQAAAAAADDAHKATLAANGGVNGHTKPYRPLCAPATPEAITGYIVHHA